MEAVFLVDRHARQQQLNAEERAALRREHAEVWVDEIHAECRKLRAHLLPKSALGEAINYTLNMSAKLRRCFDHAEVELSNNIAENSMRPIRTGCTWAARSPSPRSPQFSRWWNPAAGCRFPSKTTCWPYCRA
jgi:transposase